MEESSAAQIPRRRYRIRSKLNNDYLISVNPKFPDKLCLTGEDSGLDPSFFIWSFIFVPEFNQEVMFNLKTGLMLDYVAPNAEIGLVSLYKRNSIEEENIWNLSGPTISDKVPGGAPQYVAIRAFSSNNAQNINVSGAKIPTQSPYSVPLLNYSWSKSGNNDNALWLIELVV